MKILFSKSTLAFAIVASLLFALLFVYEGRGTPLSDDEVDYYISKIENQTQNPGGRHDLPALRLFLKNDDGQPFYTVNFYKYFEEAQYVEEQPYQGSGREAYDLFSAEMVKLLARQSSHPIFGSNKVLESLNGWDRVVIVRYRSRRDIAEIFSSDEFAEASAHKWASLERNERLLVRGLHIPELRPVVIVVLILLMLAFVFSLFRKKA